MLLLRVDARRRGRPPSPSRIALAQLLAGSCQHGDRVHVDDAVDAVVARSAARRSARSRRGSCRDAGCRSAARRKRRAGWLMRELMDACLAGSARVIACARGRRKASSGARRAGAADEAAQLAQVDGAGDQRRRRAIDAASPDADQRAPSASTRDERPGAEPRRAAAQRAANQSAAPISSARQHDARQRARAGAHRRRSGRAAPASRAAARH